MGAPRLAFLPDLLEIHFGELQNLWGRRRVALRSPDHTVQTLAALDERIEAHARGLLVVGDRVRPLVEPALASEERDAAFAAAYTLLRLGAPEAARAVVRAVVIASSAAARRGLGEALMHAPAAVVTPLYAALAAEGAPGAMAVATEVLAWRGALRAAQAGHALNVLVADEDAEVRAAGWRAAGMLAARMDAAQYAAGWSDETPTVRRAALEAAAWAGEPGVVAHGRACAARPSPESVDALDLLAVLAEPGDAAGSDAAGSDAAGSDAARVAALARAPGARPADVARLGALGSPAYVDDVVGLMAHGDPAMAAAAGGAFAKLTGHDVRSGPAVSLAPPGADPFEAEFAERVRLPDAERARSVWEEMRPALAGATRLCRGVDVGGPLAAEALDRLDLESRWAYFVRARYAGAWSGTPADLEALSAAA